MLLRQLGRNVRGMSQHILRTLKVFFNELFYYLAKGGFSFGRFDLQPFMELLVHVHAQPRIALWHVALFLFSHRRSLIDLWGVR